MQNQSCFGGRLIVAPLVHLLLIPSTPMHLKLINNPLCYLTDQIIIRKVQLKSCHTLIKKCSFNFFEQCIYSSTFCDRRLNVVFFVFGFKWMNGTQPDWRDVVLGDVQTCWACSLVWKPFCKLDNCSLKDKLTFGFLGHLMKSRAADVKLFLGDANILVASLCQVCVGSD